MRIAIVFINLFKTMLIHSSVILSGNKRVNVYSSRRCFTVFFVVVVFFCPFFLSFFFSVFFSSKDVDPVYHLLYTFYFYFIFVSIISKSTILSFVKLMRICAVLMFTSRYFSFESENASSFKVSNKLYSLQ